MHMDNKTQKEWVLPASIPFSDLKRNDLEECVYWLLDAMGAKDLEWRSGGSGQGAPDGGRDLEAHFYTPTADGELEGRKWWIECKGRTGTVESDEVKSAVNNALAMSDLDYIVIATNTRFSNPTRDWVKRWQLSHSKPRVKLWDHAQLERYLSRHPDVVLRLFSEALSLQGRFKAMESRFWNKLELITPGTLNDLWKARNQIEATPAGTFAAIANEFANGDISHRPWGAVLDQQSLADVLVNGFYNVTYLMFRCSSTGVDQEIIIRTFAYLLLAALEILPSETLSELVSNSLTRNNSGQFPRKIQEMLLMPIMNQLLSEIQDVCTSDCKRVSLLDRLALTEDNDEVANYWLRLEPDGTDEPDKKKTVIIEAFNEPCIVGFPVDKENGCPLFGTELTIENTQHFLAVIQRVAAFRKAQAAKKRETEKLKLTSSRTRRSASAAGRGERSK
jgi:hypothetical protein